MGLASLTVRYNHLKKIQFFLPFMFLHNISSLWPSGKLLISMRLVPGDADPAMAIG
jgi:hypothetical protein